MLNVLGRIPAFKLCRAAGFPRVLPINLTVSLTYKCNSRCRTCRVYERKCEELSADEYGKVFRSIGRSAYWITFSGGEPFLRQDIREICTLAYELCRPRLINIPTNGLLPERIEREVSGITRACPEAHLVINLSIDGIGDRNDDIRGVAGAYARAMETYQRLRRIRAMNLSLGIHSVISRFNAPEMIDVYSEMKTLRPDSYITEIAEQRVELLTENERIAPAPAEYAAAVDRITADMKSWRLRGISRVTRAFRSRYYASVKRYLQDGKPSWPCYAGIASCQIAPDGEVWACCIRSESLGNLREVQYDFRTIWFSRRASEIRQAIKARNCACPLANAGYTNMLLSLRTLAAVGKEVIVGR